MSNVVRFLCISYLFLSSVNVSGSIPEYFNTNFFSAMGPRGSADFLLKDKHWSLLKERYDIYAIENFQYAEAPRIPKIIHQIWLGSEFPEEYKGFQQTWKKHHPDWEYRLWTEKEIDEFGLTNKDLYDATENYGAKSDIARYEILYRIGGLYVDTDFECFRPFDIFNHCFDFYTGLADYKQPLAYIGLIAAVPGHPILKACVEGVCPIKGTSETFGEIQNRTGPFFFTRQMLAVLKRYEGPAVAFPQNYFYPWPAYAHECKTRKEVMAWTSLETWAIHHWHASWAQ